jgi:hypothetical protein
MKRRWLQSLVGVIGAWATQAVSRRTQSGYASRTIFQPDPNRRQLLVSAAYIEPYLRRFSSNTT